MVELDSQENPGEIKSREVELDSQENPGEIKSRETVLDSQENPGEIKRREVKLDPQESPGEINEKVGGAALSSVKEVGPRQCQLSNFCTPLIAVSTAVWSRVTKTVSES